MQDFFKNQQSMVFIHPCPFIFLNTICRSPEISRAQTGDSRPLESCAFWNECEHCRHYCSYFTKSIDIKDCVSCVARAFGIGIIRITRPLRSVIQTLQLEQRSQFSAQLRSVPHEVAEARRSATTCAAPLSHTARSCNNLTFPAT